MTIGRYNVDARCSCPECNASFVQNVISTMVVSPTGRWCLYEDYAKLLKVVERYEASSQPIPSEPTKQVVKIKSEAVGLYGDRLRIEDESYEEYEWIIDHLSAEIRGRSPKVYGLRDSQQNRTILTKLFNAHGVEVEYVPEGCDYEML